MPLRCPACRTPMTPANDPAVPLEIDTCSGCMGLWFDADELREFFSSETLNKKFMLPDSRYDSAHQTIDISTKARRCPRCNRQPLQRKEVDTTEVDECPICKGIWLDSGEINKLVKAAKKHGLKGEEETAKQIRQGMHDQTSLGRASKYLSDMFGKMFASR